MPRFLPSWLGRPKENLFWLTPTLAVGGEELAGSPRRLRKLGVRAVLDMQAEAGDRAQSFEGADMAYSKTAVVDFQAPDEQQLREATGWVLQHMQNDEPVYIHCRAGLGRSVTMALATLLRIGYDLPTAYNLVRKARPEIRVSESQLESLRRFQESLRKKHG